VDLRRRFTNRSTTTRRLALAPIVIAAVAGGLLAACGPARPGARVSDVVVAEAGGSATFTVTLSSSSTSPVTVSYATANGPAEAGRDYTASTGVASFAARQTSTTITVPIAGDRLDEFDETFTVGLSSPSGATIADGTGVATIVDDDAPPTVSVADATVSENTTARAVTAIALSAPSGKTVSFQYDTVGGSAVAGFDFEGTSRTVTFPAGQVSLGAEVALYDETTDEPDESFSVNVANLTNATVADGSGTVTITDDDQVPLFGIGEVRRLEGNPGPAEPNLFTFTATLTNPSFGDLRFNCRTRNGSAAAGDDYAGMTGECFVIPAGQISATFPVRVYRDVFTELDEDFFLDVTGFQTGGGNVRFGTLLNGASGKGVIRNDGDVCFFVCARENP
jgi:Calx-beta domain